MWRRETPEVIKYLNINTVGINWKDSLLIRDGAGVEPGDDPGDVIAVSNDLDAAPEDWKLVIMQGKRADGKFVDNDGKVWDYAERLSKAERRARRKSEKSKRPRRLPQDHGKTPLIYRPDA